MTDIATEKKKESTVRLSGNLDDLKSALAEGLDDAEQGRTVGLEEAMKRLQKDLLTPQR